MLYSRMFWDAKMYTSITTEWYSNIRNYFSKRTGCANVFRLASPASADGFAAYIRFADVDVGAKAGPAI